MMEYLRNVVSLEFDPDRCTGCGRCLEVCPHGVFEEAGRIIAVRNRDRCIECGACMMNCPFGALRVEAGVGCAAAVLGGMIRGGEPSCDCSSSGDCCG